MVGEIETDKTSIPINSPAAGVIEQLLVADGSTVQPGADIFKLRVGAAGSQPAATAAPSPAKSAPTAAQPQAAPVAHKPAASTPEKPAPVPSAGQTGEPGPVFGEQRVKMNRMRLRIAQRLKDAQKHVCHAHHFQRDRYDVSNCFSLMERSG